MTLFLPSYKSEDLFHYSGSNQGYKYVPICFLLWKFPHCPRFQPGPSVYHHSVVCNTRLTVRAWGTSYLWQLPSRFYVSCFYITTVIHRSYPNLIKKNFILAHSFRDWEFRLIGLATGEAVWHLMALPWGFMEGREHIFKQKPKKESDIFDSGFCNYLAPIRAPDRKLAFPPQGIFPNNLKTPMRLYFSTVPHHH